MKNIEHHDCSFYIHSATNEWSYFSGPHCEIDPYIQRFKIDEETGHLQAQFIVERPDSYVVHAVLHKEIRKENIELVMMQLERIFYQQLLMQHQEQQVATLQLMGALNSSLKIKPLLQAMMDYALKALPVIDRGFLMLYDDKIGKLYTVASKGVSDRIFDYEPGIGEGMAGYTLETGESRIYPYMETQKIMWNVTPKNMDALMDAVHHNNIEHNTSMAVPITFESRKFGVMIVHQYTNKRPFQGSDLRLLESFASQAAVALHNAEIYEKMEQLNKDYEKQDEIYKQYLKLSLQDVPTRKIISQTKHLLKQDISYIHLMNRKTFLSNAHMVRLSHIKEAQLIYLDKCYYVHPVQNEQEVFGYLLMETEQEPTKLQQLILGNASISLTLKSLQLIALNQQHLKERYELFQYLVSGEATLNDARYEEMKLDVQQPTFVMLLKISQFSNKIGQQFIQFVHQNFPAQRFIFLQRNCIAWVLQGDEDYRERMMQQLPTMLESWLKFYNQHVLIGVGTLQSNLLQLKQSFEEAERALLHVNQDELVTVIGYEQLGINRLFGKQTSAEIQHFVDEVLSPILYGKDRNLLSTLQAFIANNRSISQTANGLHIHQNTLYHRLHKIEQLLDRELSNPQHYLEISLALHLYDAI